MSDANVGTKPVVIRALSRRPLLLDGLTATRDWLLFSFGGRIRPKVVGPYDPMRSSFEKTPVSEWLRWVGEEGPGYMIHEDGTREPLQGKGPNGSMGLARKSRDGAIWGTIDNFPSVPYCGRVEVVISGMFAQDIRPEEYEVALKELCEQVPADFGFVTTEADYRRQNWFRTPYPQGGPGCISETWSGERLEHGIPGFYWLNVWPIRAREQAVRVQDHCDDIVEVRMLEKHILLSRKRPLEDLEGEEPLREIDRVKQAVGRKLFFAFDPNEERSPMRDPWPG